MRKKRSLFIVYGEDFLLARQKVTRMHSLSHRSNPSLFLFKAVEQRGKQQPVQCKPASESFDSLYCLFSVSNPWKYKCNTFFCFWQVEVKDVRLSMCTQKHYSCQISGTSPSIHLTGVVLRCWSNSMIGALLGLWTGHSKMCMFSWHRTVPLFTWLCSTWLG